MVSFRVEKLPEILAERREEIDQIIEAQWAEVGSFSSQFRLNVHMEDYLALDAQGRLLALTMRDGEEIAGYFMGVAGWDFHRDTLDEPARRVAVCSALVYYVSPEYRGYGRGLIRHAEREAAAKFGAQIMHIRVKPDRNAAGDFLRAIGYSPTETTHSRMIGEADVRKSVA